jgi:hypothetical protein
MYSSYHYRKRFRSLFGCSRSALLLGGPRRLHLDVRHYLRRLTDAVRERGVVRERDEVQERDEVRARFSEPVWVRSCFGPTTSQAEE